MVAKAHMWNFQSFWNLKVTILRIRAINDAKFHQNLLIHNASKIRGAFFDNLSRDGKSGVKVKKHALVAELKLKMSPDT